MPKTLQNEVFIEQALHLIWRGLGAAILCLLIKVRISIFSDNAVVNSNYRSLQPGSIG